MLYLDILFYYWNHTSFATKCSSITPVSFYISHQMPLEGKIHDWKTQFFILVNGNNTHYPEVVFHYVIHNWLCTCSLTQEKINYKYYLLSLGINEIRRPIVFVMILGIFIDYEIRRLIVLIIFVFTIRLWISNNIYTMLLLETGYGISGIRNFFFRNGGW